jgi:hypothetical protein
LHTVNTLRDFAGLAPVSFDKKFNKYALAAALMMNAANRLSHEPGRDWPCYSDGGDYGAGHSNLAIGRSGASAMVAYVDDSPVPSLGHRNWLLDPRLSVFGSGSTGRTNALYVIDGDHSVAVPANVIVAWPPAGWVPWQWVFDDWSLKVGNNQQDADYQNAQVTVTSDGQLLPVHDVRDKGNEVAWTVATNPALEKADHSLRVDVSGILVDGQPTPVTYTINAFQPEPPVSPPRARLRFVKGPLIRHRSRVRKGVQLTVLARVVGGKVTAYQWLRDQRPIRRATRATYRVRVADRGYQLSCRVVASARKGPKVSRTTRSVHVGR